MEVGDWEFATSNGLVMPPAYQLRDHLYNAILMRTYTPPTQLPILLLVAYNGTQDGMLQVVRRQQRSVGRLVERLEHDMNIDNRRDDHADTEQMIDNPVPGHALVA